jgi:hypothetical protein
MTYFVKFDEICCLCIVTLNISELDKDSSNIKIIMNSELSAKLMPHQKDAVQFMWTNIMAGVFRYRDPMAIPVLDSQVSIDAYYDSQPDLCDEFDSGCPVSSDPTRQRATSSSATTTSKRKVGYKARGSGCLIAHQMGLGEKSNFKSFYVILMAFYIIFVNFAMLNRHREDIDGEIFFEYDLLPNINGVESGCCRLSLLSRHFFLIVM